MSILAKIAIILILWVPFSIGAILSVPVSLWAIVFNKNVYGKDVLRSMDKLLAAVLGFSGDYTLSAECGVSKEFPWVQLRWVLNKIQAGHCEGAAKQEGLLKSDWIINGN